MASRFPSHQLSNGLYVSGLPKQAKEKLPTLSSTPAPYTGGDITKSGELGKMFDAHGENSRKSGVSTNAPSRNTSLNMFASIPGQTDPNSTARSSSGSVTGNSGRQKKNSGPQSKQEGDQVKMSSGPLAPILPTTGLITSGPLSSGQLNSGQLNSGGVRLKSGPLDHNHAVTNLSEKNYYVKEGVSIICFGGTLLLFVCGFVVGALMVKVIGSFMVLNAVALVFVLVVVILVWNKCWGRRRTVAGFIAGYPEAELRTAKNGQFVKISGVVTCETIQLQTSFQKIPRCVYTSSHLYEYRSWASKEANPKHRRFTWGLRFKERYVADFYISDFQSGLRALVKTGYGAKVTPYVEEKTVVDINKNNQDMSPEFARWLADKNLSSDDCHMRMKEGYIKEGSTVSVMGVVQRNNNILTIVPPSEPYSTGCQWIKCILPLELDGIVLQCEDTSDTDIIAV